MGNTESVGGRAIVSLSLNELEERIKRAKITGALDVSNKGLATFPNEIQQLRGKITAFSCNHNSIARIPDGLAESMVTLTKVELQSNWLTNLPPDFGKLTNLEILDLSYNLLSAPPDSVAFTSLPPSPNPPQAHSLLVVFLSLLPKCGRTQDFDYFFLPALRSWASSED